MNPNDFFNDKPTKLPDQKHRLHTRLHKLWDGKHRWSFQIARAWNLMLTLRMNDC